MFEGSKWVCGSFYDTTIEICEGMNVLELFFAELWLFNSIYSIIPLSQCCIPLMVSL